MGGAFMSRGARSNLVDLELYLHHETEKAVLVSDAGDREKAVWLPKSVIEIWERSRSVISVTVPEQLAIEKGLV